MTARQGLAIHLGVSNQSFVFRIAKDDNSGAVLSSVWRARRGVAVICAGLVTLDPNVDRPRDSRYRRRI